MTTLFPARSVWPARCAGLFLAAFVFLNGAGTSFGQRQPGLSKRPTPFARYVPASANLFITIRELGEVEGALRRAHARQLLPIIAGGSLDSNQSFDLTKAVARFLGPDSSIKVKELLKAEIGIVANSWAELGGAVWFVRAPDRSVLEGWFPTNQRRGGGAKRAVWFFRTRNGLRVIVRGDIVAMARRGGAGSLFSGTGRLMIGRGGESLEQSPHYQELFTYLPARPLAVAYQSRPNPSPDDTSGRGWLGPALDQAVIGMYEREGRMDFAIRGRRSQPHKGTPVSLEAFGKLVRLPATTLIASATTVDFGRAITQAAQNPSSPTLGRYLKLLAGLGSRGSEPTELFSRIGPQVITTWGQDLSDTGVEPQIAFLVQCADARGVRDEMTQIARNLIRLLGTIDTIDSGTAPQISRSTHLGTPVFHLSFGSYASHSRFPFLRMFGSVGPAWAARGDWLVVALSPDHIKRILDARFGLTPTLASVEDVSEVNYYRANRTSLSFAQARLASAVLEQWLEAYESGAPSLLAPSWWELSGSGKSIIYERFGFEMTSGQPAGVVVVASVDPGASAPGSLQVDDRIIGVDGGLLSLEEPDLDLRKRLEQGLGANEITLRVQRGDTMMDVRLPQQPRRSRPTELLATLAEGVRELVSLGRTLQFVTFSVHATPDDHYSARLTLRFPEVEAAEAD